MHTCRPYQTDASKPWSGRPLRSKFLEECPPQLVNSADVPTQTLSGYKYERKYVCAAGHILHVCMHLHIFPYTCLSIHIVIHIYMYTYVFVYMYVCMCIYVCTYVLPLCGRRRSCSPAWGAQVARPPEGLPCAAPLAVGLAQESLVPRYSKGSFKGNDRVPRFKGCFKGNYWVPLRGVGVI